MALGRTVGELMRSMSSLEYTYWTALAGLEPIGPERGDWHAALIARTVAEVNRDSKSTPEPYKIGDFMLFDDSSSSEEDEDVEAKLFAAFPME